MTTSETCPGCGSSQIYNSGFSIQCPTLGCRFFTEAQAMDVATRDEVTPGVLSEGNNRFTLTRGRTYYVQCKEGYLLGESHMSCASGGSTENYFTVNPASSLTLVLDSSEDYQLCCRLSTTELAKVTICCEGFRGSSEIDLPPQSELMFQAQTNG